VAALRLAGVVFYGGVIGGGTGQFCIKTEWMNV